MAGFRRPLAAPAPGPPVYSGDFPDPCIVPVDDGYYAFGTQAGGRNVPILRSGDLRRWEPVGDALPVLPGWTRAGRTWSPAVLRRGGDFVLYPVLWEPRSNRQCIGLFTAPAPAGPFTDRAGGPFVFQVRRGGSIDPSPFVDSDGTPYLLWKSDDNALHKPPSLWGQQLTMDGQDLVGEPVQLLRQDRAWEEPLIEAPALVRDGDTYYLFYSANWWESERYCIGYATASSPLGPYRKATKHGPWMASGPHALGPGGQEFFYDAGGRLCMAFHAWGPDAVGYRNGGRRALGIAGVSFVDGVPVVQP